LLKKHYAPNTELHLSGVPRPGDGFIALDKFPTPSFAIRLASPRNHEEYAKILYKSLRLADSENLSRVYAIPPEGDDLAVAIRDRLNRAASRN